MALRSFRLTLFLLVLGLTVFFSGCVNKEMVVQSSEPLLDDLNLAVSKNTDVDMVRKAMPVYLTQLDGLIVSAPDAKLLTSATQGYYDYTFAFVEDTDKQRASFLYLKARDYALGELKRYTLFVEGFDKPAPEFNKALHVSLDKRDLTFLFWTAQNWAAWIVLNIDNPEAVKDIPRVEAMLKYVIELDETYQNGNAHTSLGTLYASRSKDSGGDPEKAKEHFNKAFILSGNSLLSVHLLYAKFYARQIKDRELFIKTLEKVIETPAERFPDKAFANEVARRKAKLLLDNVDKYF
jgi:tetratricopeptide (TPR) repeat protein